MNEHQTRELRGLVRKLAKDYSMQEATSMSTVAMVIRDVFDEDAIEDMVNEEEKAAEARRLEQVAREFTERLGTVALTGDRARIAANFYGHFQDGSLEGMVRELGELDGTIAMLPDPGVTR